MCMSGALTGTAATVQVRRQTLRGIPQAITASFVVVVGYAARVPAGSRIVAAATPESASANTGCASLSFLRTEEGLRV